MEKKHYNFRFKTDPQQLALVEKKREAFLAESSELEQLHRLLLSIAGKDVVLPKIEEDLGKIVKRGQVFDGRRIRMMAGDVGQCHRNSACCGESKSFAKKMLYKSCERTLYIIAVTTRG